MLMVARSDLGLGGEGPEEVGGRPVVVAGLVGESSSSWLSDPVSYSLSLSLCCSLSTVVLALGAAAGAFLLGVSSSLSLRDQRKHALSLIFDYASALALARRISLPERRT
jgi:hypothetical protein